MAKASQRQSWMPLQPHCKRSGNASFASWQNLLRSSHQSGAGHSWPRSKLAASLHDMLVAHAGHAGMQLIA